jgi:hypothetical protein
VAFAERKIEYLKNSDKRPNGYSPASGTACSSELQVVPWCAIFLTAPCSHHSVLSLCETARCRSFPLSVPHPRSLSGNSKTWKGSPGSDKEVLHAGLS